MKLVNPFYKDKRWIRKRQNILKRDNYECRECRRYGKTEQANTVHHIYPLETHPEYKLLTINLISLCNACHEQMHNRFTGELTDKGLKWIDRIKDEVEAPLSL